MACDIGVPPNVQIDPASARREVEEDKYNVEKFLKNGAKVFIGGADLIQVENWINVTQTGFLSFAGAESAQDPVGIMLALGRSIPMVEDHGGDQILALGHKFHPVGRVRGSI